MSGESGLAHFCRRYNITSSLFYHCKKQYSRGIFNNEPTAEGALRDRVEKLERLEGRLRMENELQENRLQYSTSGKCRLTGEEGVNSISNKG
jgi:transposase-like protein